MYIEFPKPEHLWPTSPPLLSLPNLLSSVCEVNYLCFRRWDHTMCFSVPQHYQGMSMLLTVMELLLQHWIITPLHMPVHVFYPWLMSCLFTAVTINKDLPQCRVADTFSLLDILLGEGSYSGSILHFVRNLQTKQAIFPNGHKVEQSCPLVYVLSIEASVLQVRADIVTNTSWLDYLLNVPPSTLNVFYLVLKLRKETDLILNNKRKIYLLIFCVNSSNALCCKQDC